MNKSLKCHVNQDESNKNIVKSTAGYTTIWYGFTFLGGVISGFVLDSQIFKRFWAYPRANFNRIRPKRVKLKCIGSIDSCTVLYICNYRNYTSLTFLRRRDRTYFRVSRHPGQRGKLLFMFSQPSTIAVLFRSTTFSLRTKSHFLLVQCAHLIRPILLYYVRNTIQQR